MRRLALLFVLAGCGSDPDVADQHAFPTVTLAPGEEVTDLCQSWTLGNTEPLYVNTVTMTNGSGWHHSNWVFLPDDVFPGADGVWPCRERNFDGRAAAILGGVLYAQSTQATHESQQFEPGAVIVIPPHAMIIGETHALNASDAAVDTHIDLALGTLDHHAVTTVLRGLALEYHPLDIAPSAESRFTMECDLDKQHRSVLERPLDLKLHYVMPHYHRLGIGMRIEVFGGPNDGAQIFETSARTGEPSGTTLEPTFDLTGATGLRVSCTFNNPRDQSVGWGVGDQEMCVFLAFTDSELVWGGGALDEGTNVFDNVDASGMRLNHSDCTIIAVTPRS